MIVFIGKDKPQGAGIRKANSREHMIMMQELHKKGLIYFAGPFIDDMGLKTGSLIIFNTEDKEMVQEIMSRDPYVKAGLFAAREISRLEKVFQAE